MILTHLIGGGGGSVESVAKTTSYYGGRQLGFWLPLEDLQGNFRELLQEGSDLLFDENFAISVEDLYDFLDAKPALSPLPDEQSQANFTSFRVSIMVLFIA